MRFSFATATEILFGPGTVNEVPERAASMGSHAFVVTGMHTERAQLLLAQLDAHSVRCEVFRVAGEPTTDMVLAGTIIAREMGCDLVIGMGGGSAIDAAKAIAALLTNKGDLFDYLEIIGRGMPVTVQPAPYIAIPTTSGTGAEVTKNAVLISPQHQIKVSMRSPLMLPRLAVVDPLLTISMPPAVTASTGLDALTQCLEPYVCSQPNPLTDALCREGLRMAARSLMRAFQHGDDEVAREDMSIASLFGGLALANAKLGAVHGIAAPLGGMYPAPHGVVCARLLPHVVEVNVRALKKRSPDSQALLRYDEVARILTGNDAAQSADGVSWIKGLCESLDVKPLSGFGLTPEDAPVVAEKAQKTSSIKGNPIVLTKDELIEIIEKAI